MMGQNCCCSSDACRQYGCQAKGGGLKAQQSGIAGALGGLQYSAYAPLTGAMNRLAAAIEEYNAAKKRQDPT